MENAHPSHENMNHDNVDNSPNDFVEAMADMGEFRLKFPGVKQIEQMDFKNLSEDDERLLCNTVADYFVKNFGNYDGVTENAERYKNSVRFLHHDEFKDVFSRRDPRYVDGEENTTRGFYNEEDHLIYFNTDLTRDNDETFNVLIHESFHFFGIENGAGFSPNVSPFYVPEEVVKTEEDAQLFREGVQVFYEGATQFLAYEAGGKMGLDSYCDSYPVESRLASRICNVMGHDNYEYAYFETPLEIFRVQFEAAGMSQEELTEAGEVKTGEFSRFLKGLALCSNHCKEFLPPDCSEPSDEAWEEISAIMDDYANKLADYLYGDKE